MVLPWPVSAGPRRGFTLVELLVTIAIAGLLASVLLVVLGRARASGRRAACKSNLAQIGKALLIYTPQNEDRWPALAARPTASPQLPRLCDVLQPHAPDARVFRCPDDRDGFFEREGASYEWNALLNGLKQGGELESLLGPSRTPSVYDFENFHPDPGPGSYGGKNILFCDGRVAE